MNKLMHKRGRRKPIGSLIIVTVVRSLQAIHCNNIIANLILAQKLKPKIQVLLLFFFILQFKIKQIKSIMKPNLNNYEELLRINKELQKKLNEAQIEITSLREENFQLKQRLAVYENQQSTVHNIGQASGDEEVFTSSSGQDSEQYQAQFQSLNEEAEEMPQKKNNFYDQQYPENPIMTPISVTKTAQRVLSHPKVIFNYQSEGSQVPKLLMKQPKKQLIKQNSDQSQQNNENRWGNVSVEHSAIKFQEPIMARNNSSIFQRVKNSNKIYDYFFVTGYSFKQNSRAVQYCYPSQSEHFSAILSLIYTENSLRSIDTSSNMSKSPRSTNIKYGKLSVKDSFVMIIYKQKLFQRQYLFACQVEDVLEAPDHSLYIFNRLFCFITSCSFFSVYKKIIEQFINKINSSNQQVKITSPLNQNTTKQLLSGLLEEHLKILFEKNVKENQYVNFGLGNQINIFIDVPSASESYRNLLQYRPWGILFCPIYLSYQAQQIKQKELFGFLLTYMLTQTKIMLYSMVKSKVSQAVLHALQMIKPLEYVNPIIMATIKDEHQQYFNAPMSIILGLWGQPKQKRKQKIEIFMNKKPSMMGLTSLIQQNKANELDGVIFNLDTGQTCGGGITNEKNKIAIQLNCLIQNSCKSSKEKYKLIQNLLIRRTNLESLQMRELSDRLLNEIKNTQLYSFYLQKSTTMHL